MRFFGREREPSPEEMGIKKEALSQEEALLEGKAVQELAEAEVRKEPGGETPEKRHYDSASSAIDQARKLAPEYTARIIEVGARSQAIKEEYGEKR